MVNLRIVSRGTVDLGVERHVCELQLTLQAFASLTVSLPVGGSDGGCAGVGGGEGRLLQTALRSFAAP